MDRAPQLYKLMDPHLLRQLMKRTGDGTAVTVRALAEAATCAHGTIGNLLTGAQSCVPLAVANGISQRIGVDILVLFAPTGRAVPVPMPDRVLVEAAA